MSHTHPTVYIAGVGMTPTGKFLDRGIKQLTAAAVHAALTDAGFATAISSRRTFPTQPRVCWKARA